MKTQQEYLELAAKAIDDAEERLVDYPAESAAFSQLAVAYGTMAAYLGQAANQESYRQHCEFQRNQSERNAAIEALNEALQISAQTGMPLFDAVNKVIREMS